MEMLEVNVLIDNLNDIKHVIRDAQDSINIMYKVGCVDTPYKYIVRSYLKVVNYLLVCVQERLETLSIRIVTKYSEETK